MLKLSSKREPFWLDIANGVRVRVRPVTVAAIILARTAARRVLLSDDPDAGELSGMAFTVSIVQSGVVEWEGIGDADGQPIEPTPENIGQALEVWEIFNTFDRLYVGPAMEMESEKKASAPLLNGTSAGALDTAPPAPSAAKPARTKSEPRKRKTGFSRGRSSAGAADSSAPASAAPTP